jgi:REP element-mobilizing transposase RayT
VSGTETELSRARAECVTAAAKATWALYRERVGRAPRIEVAGGFYHVTACGNDGRVIFFDISDREVFLTMVSRIAREHRWVVYAYSLMTNHLHLVLQLHRGGLSAGMHSLIGGYSRRTNRRFERTGHLFHNRFYAGLIERDEHLLEACRYVVLNPVRAGICRRPEDWPWSSYRPCAGLDPAPDFLAVHRLLGLFHSDPAVATREYRTFVRTGLVPVSDTVTRV